MRVAGCNPVMSEQDDVSIPWFGARRRARELASELATVRAALSQLGGLSVHELEQKKAALAEHSNRDGGTRTDAR